MNIQTLEFDFVEIDPGLFAAKLPKQNDDQNGEIYVLAIEMVADVLPILKHNGLNRCMQMISFHYTGSSISDVVNMYLEERYNMDAEELYKQACKDPSTRIIPSDVFPAEIDNIYMNVEMSDPYFFLPKEDDDTPPDIIDFELPDDNDDK